MAKGRVVKTGGKELALELEAKGYAQFAGRGGVMNVEVRPMKTDAEQALSAAYADARAHAAGQGRGCRFARRTRSAVSKRAGCRIAASRNGNTPTCAR